MKKNIRRMISLCAISLCFLTGCSVTKEKSSVDDNNKEEMHLNVTQANLIAEITDNEKYLNPNLLYDLKSFEDSDKVGVIVTLSSAGTADTYFNDSNGYDSVADYAISKKGIEEAAQMVKEQTALSDYLLNKNLINSTKHSYTTLFNGFSAETTYGQYKKLKKLGLAQDVTITEAYARPLTVSTDSNVVENVVDVYPTGIFNSSTVKYDGENTAVAILDSGFDIYHEVFRNMPKQPMIQKSDVSDLLEATTASTFTKGLKVEDVYVNDKIPFAYDYADKDPDVAPYDSEHGTHVAGIIGGKSDVITGVAENTQLVLLKVFGDLISGAREEDILAALEDAILLKVDAINMSLGTACGFSKLQDNDYLNSVYDKIENAGISLLVAASNDYSSNYGGDESNTNKVSNPDSATVGSPSTYTAALSVASISGTKSKYIKTSEDYVFFFNEANSLAGKPFDFYEMLNIPTGENKEYEYVTVPGYGKKINYSMIDVKGKVALVKRGDISFEDKAKIAAEEGAIACIVYNNIGGDILMSAGNNLTIPFCSISKDDGEYLAKKANGKLVFNNGNEAGPFMSDFSSWGPTPDLKLKPEITAHGGNITSSIPGGGYDQLSGTSMAAPNMCGIVVLIRQYLKEKYDGISYTDLSKMTNQLLMSTATIALNEVGNPYSPRKQGAGLANLYNATNTKAYLTVDGSDKAKIELGDDPTKSGVYTLKFNIVNISNKNLTYTLSNLSMTESVSTSDSRFVAEKAYMLDPSTKIKVSGEGSLNGEKITVNANGTAQVEYTLTLSEAEKKYIRKTFINGMYVEGYATLKAENEEVDLSIPYLAFFGDWTVAPMFDKTFYEVETEAHNTGIDEEDKIKADYYATTPLGTYYYNYIIPLGSYVYQMDENSYDPIPATEEHAAIGYTYDTINGITCVYAGLLRDAKKMTTTITNTKTGEVVYENIKYNQLKAHYNGIIVPSYELLDISIEELGLANNTNYTYTMKAELDYGEDGGVETNLNNEFSFSFYVDFEAPVITNTNFYYKYDRTLKKNRYYVDFYIYDNHYTQSIRPFSMIDGKFSSLIEYPIPVYGDRGTTNKVTMEITDYMDLLQYGSGSSNSPLTNGLGIMIDDYAMNSNYYFITLPGTDVIDDGTSEKGLYFVDEDGNQTTSLIMNVGEEYNLAKMIRSNDPTFDASSEVQEIYMSKLYWVSSNENVLRVKDGKIEAIAAGNATITAQTVASNGYGYTASIAVVVRKPRSGDSTSSMARQMAFTNNVSLEEIKFTYYDTIKAFINGPERSEIGETGDRNFFTEKSNITFYPSEQVKIGYEITPWNLDPSRYSLTWSSNNPEVASVDETGLVTALKEGNATITLRITVDGKLSSLIARTRVVVKNEFIIDGRTLTGYKGFGGEVVIPDDKGIIYIGAFAFSLYTTDMNVKVDEDDWDRNKTPGTNDTIKSVVIPSGVTEVQKYAFYNCSALEEVRFVNSNEKEACKKIKEFAFYKNSSLKTINLEYIQNIGESAFEGCTQLEAVDFSSIYSLGKSAFKDCTSLTSVNITTLRNAWPEAFMNCTNLTTIISGQFTKFSEGMFTNTGLTSVTFYADRIPNKAFLNCNNLTEVDIVNDIIYVGESAFEGCKKINNVTFRGSCDYIYSSAFKGNTALTSIELPNSSISIESYAFFNCSKLSTVSFGSNTKITENFGTVFAGCDALENFIVNNNNPYYSSSNSSIMVDKENTTIIFAAPKYNFGNYTIPANITKIADGAFSGNSNLIRLNLGSVTEIGKFAFAECTRLESVTFPQEGLTLKQGAFQACIKLSTVENINCLEEIAPYAFASTAIITLQLGDNVTVGDGAFEKITALKLVTIGENATLEYASFRSCTGLTQVNLAGSIEIKEEAFFGCTKLANIDLSKAVNVIGANAFYNCQSLKSAVLTNITRIEDFAFGDCFNLKTLEMPQIEYIGDAAFAAVSETAISGGIFSDIVFPESLKYIGEAAFYSCINLRSVSLPSVTEIKGFAFAYCSSLQTVTLNDNISILPEYIFYKDTALVMVNTDNVEYIEASAFYDCNKLQNLNLNKVKQIGASAFYHCTSLTEVNLPEATAVGDTAFLSSTGITTVTMPKMEYLGYQSLSNIGVGTLTIPQTIQYVAPTAFFNNENQTDFVYIDANNTPVNEGIINDYAQLVNGALYVKSDNGKLVLSSYPTGKMDKVFEIADNTSRIELYAAGSNPYITKIVLPDTLISIGNMAFFDCTALTTVEFRSTVAPTLEGSLAGSQSDYDYSKDTPVYELLYKYLMLNGFYPYYYGQFKFMVGTSDKLKIVLPSNSVEGYDNVLYSLYFDIDNVERTGFVSKDKYTLNYLDKIVLVPTGKITLKDDKAITDARAAYNALRQDLKDFGYDANELNALYENLVRAEKDYKELKTAQVNSRYVDLIAEIKALGSEFNVSKVDDYAKLALELQSIDENDKEYMDTSNVDNFKINYENYIKNLTEEVDTLKQISELPTYDVARAALIAGLSIAQSLLTCCFLIFGKRWFF